MESIPLPADCGLDRVLMEHQCINIERGCLLYIFPRLWNRAEPNGHAGRKEDRRRDFAEEFRHARRGLETLGYQKKEARSRITRACEEFLAEGKDLEEEAIFNRAIRVRI